MSLGKKSARTVSVEWDVWYEAKRVINERGLTVSDVIGAFLRRIAEEGEIPAEFSRCEDTVTK